MAIGIFDSGIGGITVYKKLKEKYPNLKIIYFADLKNFPYGEKNKEQLNNFTEKIVSYLLEFNVESVIIACNTASAVSKNNLEKKFNIKFYSVIDAISTYLKDSNFNNLSLLATNMTVKSMVYQNILKNKLKYVVPAPKLVECAENLDKKNIYNIIKNYISSDMALNTHIILGCTHFPLLKSYIYNIYPNISLLDPAEYLSQVVEIKNSNESSDDIFITSDRLEYFKKQLNNILKKENLDVRIHKW